MIELEEMEEASKKVLKVLLKKYDNIEDAGEQLSVVLNILVLSLKSLLDHGMTASSRATTILCIQNTLSRKLLSDLKKERGDTDD